VNEFIAKYHHQLNGVPAGFDRIVFRGTVALNLNSEGPPQWSADQAPARRQFHQAVWQGVRWTRRRSAAWDYDYRHPFIPRLSPQEWRARFAVARDAAWAGWLASPGGFPRKPWTITCSALAAVDDCTTLQELAAKIERRVRWQNKPVRALHPFDPQDHALLAAINQGEFAINGLRYRDLQALLYSSPATEPAENAAARPASAVSSECSALMGWSANCLIRIAIVSPREVALFSTLFSRRIAWPLNNSRRRMTEIFAWREESMVL